MAGNKTRNEIWYYSIFGAVVLIGTVALMLFGKNPQVSDDIGPLLAGLAVSIYLFRFGVPWVWLNFLLLASFLVVGLLLGQPGLMWMGGYVAGSQFGVAWRLAVVQPKVRSEWTVNGRGIGTLTEARKVAQEALHSLDGDKRARVVVEHGSARFEVAGTLPSKLVCHRNPDADDENSWAILSRTGHASDESVEVPMGRMKGFIPSQFVHDIGPVEAALEDFLKNPKPQPLRREWNTDPIAFDLRLSVQSKHPGMETEMTTDVNALTLDMLKFAGLLRLISQPQLAQNYESLAVELRSDPSDQGVEDAREWVRTTLRGGSGGLGDVYVQKKDGSLDEVLDQEYQELLQRLTDFANGGEAPLSPLLKQIGNSMFANGYAYFRQVEAPVRKGLLVRGHTMYEVMTEPGATRRVGWKQLGEALGHGPQSSRRDMQECQAAADRLFREGRSDDWVHYSSAQVVPGESLQGLT